MSDTIETAVELGRALSESEAERKRTLAVLDLTAAQRDKFVAEWGRLRAGIEALADEWEAESQRLTAFIEGTPGPGSLFAGSPERRHARLSYQHASALRALLSTDDEKAGV